MKKVYFKVLSAVMTLATVVCCFVVPGNAVQQKNVKMIVLGDSVAFGVNVEQNERFGDVLAADLENDGYTVDYTNYSVPKYGMRSVYYDLHEDTYAYDNNRYVAELGANDFRGDIPYEEFIGDVATSDIIVLHLGENDMAASFYKLRGYDDYYIFYGGERNNKIFQDDIDNGKVDGIYTLNELKIAKVKKEFEQNLRYYLDENIKRIKELNPDAQIIVCDMFNPYIKAANAMTSMFDLMKYLPLQALDLLKSTDIYDFFNKFASLTNNYNTLIQLMNVMIPGLTGKDMDHCDVFDISNLRTTQKILFKIQYIRAEKAAVEMYDIANTVIPEVVEENGVTLAEMSKTNTHEYMSVDKTHPGAEGHRIMADELYRVTDFDKLG